MALYMPGDIIHDYEEPAVTYLNIQCRDMYCSNCFKTKNYLKRAFCTCSMVFYCSKECKEADLKKVHRLECGLRGLLKDDAWNQVIRLLCYFKINQDVVQKNAMRTAQIYDGTMRSFNDQRDHYNDLRNISSVVKMLDSLAGALRETNLFSEMDLDQHNLFRLFGIWKINGFSIPSEDRNGEIGSALYVKASVFDHSCRPNAVAVYDKKFRLQIRCIEIIPMGERPHIAYFTDTQGVVGRTKRRSMLQERYHFLCRCTLCTLEANGVSQINYSVFATNVEFLKNSDSHADIELARAEEVLRDLSVIFSRYDERTVNFHYVVLLNQMHTFFGTQTVLKTPIVVLRSFARRLEEKMRHTYGTDHSRYKFYERRIARLLNIDDD